MNIPNKLPTIKMILLIVDIVVILYMITGVCSASSSNIKGICSGDSHVLVLLTNGTVWSWGYNVGGGCGQQINETDALSNLISSPVMVEGISNVTAVSAGSGFSIALKDDGTVWSWGWDYDGVLGRGLTMTQTGPQRIAKPAMIQGLSHIIAIDTTYRTAYALKDDGTVWVWGSNIAGQIGDGVTKTMGTSDVSHVSSPVQVKGLTNVKAIFPGTQNVFVLKDDGSVWAWGMNNSALCDMQRSGNDQIISTPSLVPCLNHVKSIAMGQTQMLWLRDDGTVWVWGYDSQGCLGLGDLNESMRFQGIPVQILGLSDAIAISAEMDNSAVVCSNGSAMVWGDNVYGQLGDGTFKDRNMPFQVSIKNVTMIDCTSRNTFMVDTDGYIFVCGDNGACLLGTMRGSDMDYQSTPVKILFEVGRVQSQPTTTSPEVTPIVTELPVVTEQTQPSVTEPVISTPVSSSPLPGGNSILMIGVVLFTIVALGFIVYLVVRK